MNDKNEFEEIKFESEELMQIVRRRSEDLESSLSTWRYEDIKFKHPYTTFIDEHSDLNVEISNTDKKSFASREVKFILQSLEIENFKSIRKSKINLGTSSFISGYNSSGKSTHTQLILLLIQWLSGESISQKGSVPLNGPFITLGDEAKELINRSIQQEFEKSQKDAFKSSKNDFLMYGVDRPLIRAIFNFATSEDDNPNERSIIFSLGPNNDSASSFMIHEITIKDKILQKDQIEALSNDFDKESRIEFNKEATSVTYIQSFKNLHIRDSQEEKLSRMEIVGNMLTGNAMRHLKENPNKIKSFFKEEVVVNDKSYSINSTNCSKLSLTSKTNSPLGEDGQVSMILDQNSALRISLFTGFSNNIPVEIMGVIKEAIQDIKGKNQKSNNPPEIVLDTIQIIKKSISNVFNSEIRRFERLEDENQNVNSVTMLNSILQDFDKKTDDFKDSKSLKNNTYDIIYFLFSLNNGSIPLMKPSDMGPNHIFGGSEFARQIRDFFEVDDYEKVIGARSFEMMFLNWISYSVKNYLSNLIKDLPESLSLDNTDRLLRRIEAQLKRDLSRTAFSPIEQAKTNLEKALNAESLIVFTTDIEEKITFLLNKLKNLMNKKIEKITLDLKTFKTEDIKNRFVLTESIKNNVTEILDDLLKSESKKSKKGDFYEIETLFLLSILIPTFQDLNTMNNLINEFSIIESEYSNNDDFLDNILRPSGEKIEILDYVIMSSFTNPQIVREKILIKNSIPLFDTRFLNSSRGYTYQSEFYSGKENTPLGINGEFTASYLLQHEKDMISGPDIRFNSPNYLLNLFEDQDFQIKFEIRDGIIKPKTSQGLHSDSSIALNKTLIEHLNHWIKYIFGIDEKISVRETGFGNTTLYFGNDLISNVGSGISQALPIIVNTIIAKDKFLFLEEVEQNLHASAQAKIADMIVMFSLFDRRFLVETHSDHLLNRLRLRHIQLSRAFDLTNNPIFNIYFIKHSEETDSIAQEMPINEKGQFSSEDIDKGFFDQSQLDTLSIIKELKEF